MDFGLKEISITIIIGAYTILGFELVLYILFKISLTGYIREIFDLVYVKTEDKSSLISSKQAVLSPAKEKEEKTQAQPSSSAHHMRLAAFLFLSFGIGILAEDLSYKFVDNELPFNLPTRFDSRVISLIGDINNPEIDPLVKELAKNGAFLQLDSECGSSTEKWFLAQDQAQRQQIEPCPKGEEINKQITGSIKQLYYHAKNNVYRDLNYYDEMKKIQFRIDFTRSISVISFCFLVAALFILVIQVLVLGGTFAYSKIYSKNRDVPLRNLFNKIKILLITAIVLFITICFTTLAFYKESAEFNKRAFGYYSTILFNERLGRPNDNKKK